MQAAWRTTLRIQTSRFAVHHGRGTCTIQSIVGLDVRYLSMMPHSASCRMPLDRDNTLAAHMRFNLLWVL